MKWITGGVTAARGFKASGVSAGIKRSRKPDLALVAADRPITAAAVFTNNRVQAAPVLVSKSRVARGRAQAVLINSGCANCLTGDAGLHDARLLSQAVARELGVADRDILLGSTGLIGRRLPVPRMLRVVPKLVKHLNRAHHADAAQAILTTDLMVKEAAVEARIHGRLCRLGGMAKGAGMIAPSMATMLCVLTTDVEIAPGLLRRLLREATEQSFNQISVDGDMSTNDTVFALASARSGVSVRSGGRAAAFAKMLHAVTGKLATMLVSDGEGVAKLMEVVVTGARNDRDAHACARQIANSPLVKTMLSGGDSNPGRIAAAVGASPARCDQDKLEIAIGSQRVVARGIALRVDAVRLRSLLRRPQVRVLVNLHLGRGQGRMLGCDLTEEYVRINAGYAT